MLSPNRRRRVRLPCAVVVGGSKVEGCSTDVSASGVHVRLPLQKASTLELSAGARVQVRLQPSDEPPVRSTAEVVWLNPHELDVGGKPAHGYGLRFVDLPMPESERLLRIADGVRATVLLVGEWPELVVKLRNDYRVLAAPSFEAACALLDSDVVAVVAGRNPETLRAIAARFPQVALADLPETLKEARHTVRRAVDTHLLAQENEQLKRALVQHKRSRRAADVEADIIGQSETLRKMLAELERVRRTDVTVHIHGETGSGKELVARALARPGKPFITQNCAGLTETLLQSTLFGHKRGAFTGADRDHAGVFVEANGGTLFLDEVAELSAATQASLLRVLQDGEVMPLGASRPLRVDVRIVSATHKNLREEVREGRFREDLYFRLVVVLLRVPPLRERTGDVVLLAAHFLEHYAAVHGKRDLVFAPATLALFERYAWPGNVRELANEIERLVVLADDGDHIAPERVSPHLSEMRGHGVAGVVVPAGLAYDDAVLHLEKELISEALARSGGSIAKAAELLGMDRSRLGKLRLRLGIE